MAAAPSPSPPQSPAPGLSAALLEAELQQLAASAAFRQSPRHVRFLRHLVDAVMAGESARLREMTLGVEVFYRQPAKFDPRSDSIVRVEARRLRQKLARYYAEEGQQARLEFALPVGSYRVELRHRQPVPPAERHRASVGVYPLLALGDSPGLESLAPALSAELVGALTRLNGLRVVALTGPAPAIDPAELRRAGRRVNVGSLVRGSMARQGQQWRLELQLFDSERGQPMWSRQALSGDAETLATLETLARGIVAELHRDAAQRQLQRITQAGRQPLLPALGTGAPSRETLERLSLARLAMRLNTPDGYRKAEALCEQAIAAEPRYGPAYALLADALLGSVGLTVLPSLPTLESCRRAALRAIELDPTLPDPHDVLGQVHLVLDRDWPRAEASALAAIRLAPGAARVHARHGWLLMMNRRFAEARASYAEARDLDPLSALYRAHEALVSIYERQWSRAETELLAVLDVVPDHLVALALNGALQLYTGQVGRAEATYRHLDSHYPKLSIGRCGRAQVLALQGEVAAARHELQAMTAIFEAGYLSPYQIAMVHTRLGEPEAALHWLRESARLCDFNYACVAVDPTFDALHEQGDFRQLLRDTGLAHLAD